jgi:hypothetical protein
MLEKPEGANQKWKTQSNWQHQVHKTKDENKR